jgi:hypothetical protein
MIGNSKDICVTPEEIEYVKEMRNLRKPFYEASSCVYVRDLSNKDLLTLCYHLARAAYEYFDTDLGYYYHQLIYRVCDEHPLFSYDIEITHIDSFPESLVGLRNLVLTSISFLQNPNVEDVFTKGALQNAIYYFVILVGNNISLDLIEASFNKLNHINLNLENRCGPVSYENGISISL